MLHSNLLMQEYMMHSNLFVQEYMLHSNLFCRVMVQEYMQQSNLFCHVLVQELILVIELFFCERNNLLALHFSHNSPHLKPTISHPCVGARTQLAKAGYCTSYCGQNVLSSIILLHYPKLGLQPISSIFP